MAPDSTWSVGGWLRSLSLSDVVAEALEEPLGADPYSFVLSLTREELGSKLKAAGLEGLAAPIWSAAEGLRQQKAIVLQKAQLPPVRRRVCRREW